MFLHERTITLTKYGKAVTYAINSSVNGPLHTPNMG